MKLPPIQTAIANAEECALQISYIPELKSGVRTYLGMPWLVYGQPSKSFFHTEDNKRGIHVCSFSFLQYPEQIELLLSLGMSIPDIAEYLK